MMKFKGRFAEAIVFADEIESSCYAMMESIVNNPAFHSPIRVMPDVHTGVGSVIGFTMPFSDRIMPTVVGVDIGCGMLSAQVDKKVLLSPEAIDNKIRSVVPLGFNIHAEPVESLGDCFWEVAKRVGMKPATMANSIGSLGGGNHFIEIGEDSEDKSQWITIHSGSRNFGKQVCDYWTKVMNTDTSKQDLRNKITELKLHYTGPVLNAKISQAKLEGSSSRVNFLSGETLEGYLHDMQIAQEYAKLNRATMLRLIQKVLKIKFIDEIESVHNYVDFNDRIIRKGAISAHADQRVIIPWNMKDGLILGVGLGNEEWNFSAPHGAGRVMSRSEAKRSFTKAAASKEMAGIYTSCIPVDEVPGAYKNPTDIERYLGETVKITNRVAPILNIKSGEE